MDEDSISHQINGAAIEVHRTLGPGLLESIYESALEMELGERVLKVRRQVELSVLINFNSSVVSNSVRRVVNKL